MTNEQDCEKTEPFHDETAGMETIHPVTTNNVRPKCFNSTLQEVLFVLTATMAIAMGSLLSGSVVVISSFVGRDLDMSQAQITWVASSSSLTSGAFLLFFGRVADLFGTFESVPSCNEYEANSMTRAKDFDHRLVPTVFDLCSRCWLR